MCFFNLFSNYHIWNFYHKAQVYATSNFASCSQQLVYISHVIPKLIIPYFLLHVHKKYHFNTCMSLLNTTKFSFQSAALYVTIKYWESKHDRDFTQIKNKRPMGHIAHLRKQFNSINTYDYIIMLIKRRKKPFLILEFIGSLFEQT